MRVAYDDPEPNGLAAMLGGLIEANLERHPDRTRLLAHAVVEIGAPDAGAAATLRLDGGSVRVANGPSPDGRHVSVSAGSHDLLLLASAPLRFGLPDALTPAGRLVLRRVATRRIRIAGLLRHPGRVSRLSRLLSVV